MKNAKIKFVFLVWVALGVVLAGLLSVQMSYAQSPATIDSVKPSVKAPPIPLMGHLLRPTMQWMDDYSDKPVKEVAMHYTMRTLIDAANRQQKEIESLKIEVQALKGLVHGIQTGGVIDPNDNEESQ